MPRWPALVSLVVLIALTAVPAGAHSIARRPDAAIPTATPPPIPSPPLTCGAGRCGPPPCKVQHGDTAPLTLPAPRIYRTRQGVQIRLRQMPDAFPVTALALDSDTVAWIRTLVDAHTRQDGNTLSLDHDTVVWPRTTRHGQYATSALLSRRLTDGAFRTLVSSTVRLINGRYPTAPHVENNL